MEEPCKSDPLLSKHRHELKYIPDFFQEMTGVPRKYKLGDSNKIWPQYLAVMIALLSIFTSGIHTGWASPSLPKLLSSDYNVTSEDASYIASLPSIGDVIGSIISCLVVDVIGRKITLLTVGPLFIISNIFTYFLKTSLALLYTGRILGGVAEGICFTTVPMYIGEISEPKIRGSLGSFFTFFFFFGVLFINLLGTRCSIEVTSLITITFPSLFFILFFAMPESPYYYLMKWKNEEAKLVLQKLRHRNSVDEELSTLTRDVKRQMSERGRWCDLLTNNSNKTALTILCVMTIVQMFTGIAALTYYAQLFFKEATDVIPEDWAVVVLLVIQLVLTFVVVAIVDIVGRRVLLLFSTCGCFVTLSILGTFFLVKDFSSLDVGNLSWFPLFGMIAFIVAYMAGLGVIVTCLCGELLSASVKAKGVCVANVVYGLVVFASTKLYQSLADDYSMGVPLLIFALVQVFGFFFVWKRVPETKGKTLEEIQQDFKRLS